MAAVAQARQQRPDTDTAQPAQVPEEEQPPSAPLPPAASPPTGGEIKPTVKPDTQLVKPEEDEELAKLTGTIDKLFPQVKPPERNPWAMAAMMLPAALGQPATALSMMEGYQSGQAAREQYARGIQEQRARMLMPYFEQSAASRSTARIQTARLDLESNRAAFTQELQSAQFANDQFKWANPSAAQKLQAETQRIVLAARTAHQLAQEAIASGRLDVYQQHMSEWADLMQQSRDNTRSMVDLAYRRLDEGTPTNVINMYKFAAGKVSDLQNQMAWVTPTQAKALQGDLNYYRGLTQKMRPQVERLGVPLDETTGEPTPTGGGVQPPAGAPRGFSGAGTGAERTYQTRYSGTMTTSQVGNMIAQAKSAGRTPAQISSALQEEGINPADFNY